MPSAPSAPCASASTRAGSRCRPPCWRPTRPTRWPGGLAAAVEAFCLRVLELVRPHCGVVKPQSAFFELAGPPGMLALARVLRRAADMGFVTILDAKRGDIASTATAYADAAFGGVALPAGRVPVWAADALTVNPYLGADAVEPFVTAAVAAGGGVFVLVRTSNPGAGLFQDLVCAGRPVYDHVAEAVAGWNAATVAGCGYGAVGGGRRGDPPARTGRAAGAAAGGVAAGPRVRGARRDGGRRAGRARPGRAGGGGQQQPRRGRSRSTRPTRSGRRP